jgi:DNA-binding SARP family transcriptional activator
MQVRLFGELEAEHAGVPVPVRGAKQRALLALRPGQPVSVGKLIDVLWGDGLAAHPANALQAQIGQLRRTLGATAIITTEAGYALDVGPEDVDMVRFERLVAQGRRLAEASTSVTGRSLRALTSRSGACPSPRSQARPPRCRPTSRHAQATPPAGRAT